MHHGEALRRETRDAALVTQLARDYRKAKLDSKTLAILEYAVALTRDAVSLTRDDIQALRERGVSDEEILHASAIASYFNYINRISDALGVELEPDGRSSAG